MTGTDRTFVIQRPRIVLELKGPQALWFLDQLVTNKVDELASDRVVSAFLLDPHGRIMSSLRICNRGASVSVDTELSSIDLYSFFTDRIFATQVEIEDASERSRLVSVFGPDSHEIVRDGLHRMDSPEAGATYRFAAGHLIGVAAPSGIDLVVSAGMAEEVIAALVVAGAHQATNEDYERARIQAGVPSFGVDFDETFLPQEAAGEHAVHFDKGCYLGQEAVAMTQRGRVKRRLRWLRFEDEAVLGDVRQSPVASDGTLTSAGSVTSAAGIFGIGPITTNLEDGGHVSVIAKDGAASMAVVTELPNTSRGPQVPSARALRERLQGAADPR
ncbi:MAG: hypothetical protein LC723_02740 [Actinobacteria bacterium]|nr:hypothetical protein [Actinomycetota bacterium]